MSTEGSECVKIALSTYFDSMLTLPHISKKKIELACTLTTQDNALKMKYFERYGQFEDFSRVVQAI